MHSIKKHYRSVAIAGCLLACGFTAAVSAAEPNFNYSAVSINLVGVNFDNDVFVPIGTPTEGFARYDSWSGITLNGTLQVAPNVVIGAGISRFSNSGLGTEINGSQVAIGAAYVAPLGPATDLILSGEGVRANVEDCNRFGCLDASDTGIAGVAQIRHWATRSFEINGSVGYINFSDFDNSSSLRLGGAFWFNDNSSVGLALGFSSNATSASVGYRFAF